MRDNKKTFELVPLVLQDLRVEVGLLHLLDQRLHAWHNSSIITKK